MFAIMWRKCTPNTKSIKLSFYPVRRSPGIQREIRSLALETRDRVPPHCGLRPGWVHDGPRTRPADVGHSVQGRPAESGHSEHRCGQLRAGFSDRRHAISERKVPGCCSGNQWKVLRRQIELIHHTKTRDPISLIDTEVKTCVQAYHWQYYWAVWYQTAHQDAIRVFRTYISFSRLCLWQSSVKSNRAPKHPSTTYTLD